MLEAFIAILVAVKKNGIVSIHGPLNQTDVSINMHYVREIDMEPTEDDKSRHLYF